MLRVWFKLILFVSVCRVSAQNYIVEDVKVQGNTKMKANFVRLISDTKKGKVLDSVVLKQDIIRLKRLPGVSHAYFQVFKSHDNRYNVFYNIEENFTINPQLNIYTTNADEFAFRAGLYEFNALGRNIAVGGFYQQDVFDSFGFNIRAPFLFNNAFGVALNYQDLTTQEPVFLPGGTADYKYNNTSFEILALYEFNFKHRIEAGVTFFNEDYTYLFGATANDIPQALNVDKLLYKLVYEYNAIDYYYQYAKGFRSVLNVQYVKANDLTLPDFTIWWNDFQYFSRIGTKGNWANRLRIGLATNANSPFAPFSVDNNLNVRGVGNTIDRGTGVVVLNTEYRHTLFDKKSIVIQSNAFIDAGSWRNPGGDFGDFSKNQNLRIYPGIGFRVTHKKIFNATFRVDYGYGITPNSTSGFVFGVGQYF